MRPLRGRQHVQCLLFSSTGKVERYQWKFSPMPTPHSVSPGQGNHWANTASMPEAPPWPPSSSGCRLLRGTLSSVLYESSVEFHFKVIQELHTTSNHPLSPSKEILISNSLYRQSKKKLLVNDTNTHLVERFKKLLSLPTLFNSQF